MIGGLAWLYRKQKQQSSESPSELSTMREHPYGHVQSLEGFLSRYHPGIKIFQAHNSNIFEVLLPEDHGRLKSEKACDEAFERFKP